MAIQNDNNKSLAETLGSLYEPGTDGTQGSATTVKKSVADAKTRTFTGRFRSEGGKILFITDGNGEFEVDFKNPPKKDELTSTSVTIGGVQVGARIQQAVVRAAPPSRTTKRGLIDSSMMQTTGAAK